MILVDMVRRTVQSLKRLGLTIFNAGNLPVLFRIGESIWQRAIRTCRCPLWIVAGTVGFFTERSSHRRGGTSPIVAADSRKSLYSSEPSACLAFP